MQRSCFTLAKVRQDAWSHEDDLLLAETVLRHVREGSTQLKAFEEVGDQLNRTSAACGFRWNAEVRNKYVDAMELAKRQRKERKRLIAKQNKTKKHKNQATISKTYTNANNSSQQTLTLETVIQFLQDMNQNYTQTSEAQAHIEQIEKENEKLNEQIRTLETKLKTTENELNTMKEDYQTFIQIMDRARKMTVLDDQDSLKAPAFKMDKNGNLEQLVQSFNQ